MRSINGCSGDKLIKFKFTSYREAWWQFSCWRYRCARPRCALEKVCSGSLTSWKVLFHLWNLPLTCPFQIRPGLKTSRRICLTDRNPMTLMNRLRHEVNICFLQTITIDDAGTNSETTVGSDITTPHPCALQELWKAFDLRRVHFT